MGRAVVMNPLAASECASKTASGDNGVAEDEAGDEASAAHAVGINPSLRGTEREDIAQGVVRSVQMLLNDVGLAHDVDEAEKLVESGRFVTVMTEHGETFSAVGAVGGTSRTPSDLSLTARRDKSFSAGGERYAQNNSYVQIRFRLMSVLMPRVRICRW